MTRHRTKRGGFTLAELIMAVALLAFFSTFIVQLFAKADFVQNKARNLDQAVICAANLADQWRMDETDGVLPEVLALRQYPGEGKYAKISLDKNFSFCEPAQAYYQALLQLQPLTGQDAGQDSSAANTIWQLSIEIGTVNLSDGGKVYALTTSRYYPQEVSGP